ncbi:MAG: UDP-N-acetylmuramoyl-tripeptide--D-alanyl-D-alanine ligase [Gallionella sp.]
MMLLTRAAADLGARLIGEDVEFTGVCSDSRKLVQGDLFVAIRGERFDGYQFIGRAQRCGAVAAMVNADSLGENGHGSTPDLPLLVVEDTRLALGLLAESWRGMFDIPLVAITGSNGKTTVKEMLASILRVAAGSDTAVLATSGNLNNDIGMPHTLLQLNAEHRYAVIEMGMNHAGEIDYLTRIAAPNVALINNASTAHLQGLGSVDEVARAKGEIFAGLCASGTAIINGDDAAAPLWKAMIGAHQMLEFGLNQDSDVSGTWHWQRDGMTLQVSAPPGYFTARLRVPGQHNAYNALAATAAAVVLNVPLETIATGLEKFAGVSGRMQRKSGILGATLIDDTYNANPQSLRAAIDVLARISGKRLLVLGDMGELGEQAAGMHADIGAAARQAGIDKLFALGELSTRTIREFGAGGRHFERIEELQSAVARELDANTTVLVKGSRFMKMERVVDFLDSSKNPGLNPPQEASCS